MNSHRRSTSSALTLVPLLLLLLSLVVACADTKAITVAPATDQPTFIWIFSDP
ncbi:MAG TPA: hypothetical protein P5121_00455 [Caldilineaceae bacterium]|nr:hypothetical protein [Caldilineaceae bacterium]